MNFLHPDFVRSVLHLRQSALYVPQLEVKGDVGILVALLLLSQRSCGLLKTLERSKVNHKDDLICINYFVPESQS